MMPMKTFWLVSLIVVSGCALDTAEGVGSANDALRWGGEWGRHRATPLIFDTDLDFDDAAALAFLCQQHEQGEIDLLAVTITNNGAGTPGEAIRHARCILAECGLPDIPVADGSNSGVNAAPPELRFAVSSVLTGAFAGCTESSAPSSISAEQLLVDTIRASRRRVVLLTTGPLSNVASALELDAATPWWRRRGPPISTRIRAMYTMGGALDVGGNLLGTGTEAFDNSQELNIWIDPPAAQAAFDTLRRVRLVPLDATADVPVTAAFYARLSADQTTPEAQVVVRILDQPITQLGMSIGAFYWWDPLAAVAATSDADVVDFDRDRVLVVQGGPQDGRTVSSREGVRMRVGRSADQARFEQIFLDELNGR